MIGTPICLCLTITLHAMGVAIFQTKIGKHLLSAEVEGQRQQQGLRKGGDLHRGGVGEKLCYPCKGRRKSPFVQCWTFGVNQALLLC